MTIEKKAHLRIDLVLPITIALAITLWAFYIDEGKYNFNGIFKPDNFIFLTILTTGFWAFQLLLELYWKSLLLPENLGE